MFFSPRDKDYVVFSLAFAYGTLFMSPDLDLAHKIKLFSIRGFLTLPFRTYALVFKHRGVSHWPLVGTMSRVLWLFLYFVLIAFLFFKFESTMSSFGEYLQLYQIEILFALGALALADISHILVDKVTSFTNE